jgi:hypothetical protein
MALLCFKIVSKSSNEPKSFPKQDVMVMIDSGSFFERFLGKSAWARIAKTSVY